MQLLRYLLLAASAGTAGFLIYVSITGRVQAPWFVYGWAAACVVNFVYLLLERPPVGSIRLFRLVALWLDAKESELRARINHGVSNDSGKN